MLKVKFMYEGMSQLETKLAAAPREGEEISLPHGIFRVKNVRYVTNKRVRKIDYVAAELESAVIEGG